MRANSGSPRLQSLQGMLQIAMTNCGGSDYQRAVGNRFGHRFVLYRAGQDGRGVHGGTGALKCDLVWIHHPQMVKPEVAHGPSGRADVERIPRLHQDDAQMIEFGGSRQGILILRQPQRNRVACHPTSRGTRIRSKPFAGTPVSQGMQM
jgi:hypothetical protein